MKGPSDDVKFLMRDEVLVVPSSVEVASGLSLQVNVSGCEVGSRLSRQVSRYLLVRNMCHRE